MAILRDVLFLASGNTRTTSPPTGLFVSDGTTAGTTKVIASGLASALTIPSSAQLTYDTVFGLGTSLYATDPATGIPAALAVPGLASVPLGLVSLGNTALFSALDGAGNTALWRTDGTAAGTTEVASFGTGVTLDSPTFARIGNKVVFWERQADGGLEFWSSDGTAAGTTALLHEAGGLSQIQPIGVVGGRLAFGLLNGSNDASIWTTDGTAAGTVQIATAPGLAKVGALAPNGMLVFSTNSDGQIFATDGTSVVALTPAPTSVYGPQDGAGAFVGTASGAYYGYGMSFFGGNSGNLMITDGTAAGIHVIAVPFAPGSTFFDHGPQPDRLTAFGSRLLFTSGDLAPTAGVIQDGLWITDGTAAGTTEIAAGINPVSIVVDGARAFVTDSAGLYVTDGTAAGTMLASTAAPVLSAPVLNAARATVPGLHTQYRLALDASGTLRIVDTVAGRDGAATDPGAHIVAFSDGVGVLDPTGNAEAVTRIYLAAFGKAPDLAGLLSYTEQVDAGTLSLTQIASAALQSQQFQNTYGTLGVTVINLQPGNLVQQLYENADGRAPDPGGLAAYTAALTSGQTTAQVLLSIAESPEARLHSLAVAGNMNDGTVTRLYEAIDARAPDAGGKIAYASDLDGGQSIAQIAQAMLSSGEYDGRFGMPSNTTFVTELYQNLLGRAPDPGGLAGYTAALAGGQSRAALVAGFVGSDEARLATSQATHQGSLFLS